MNDQNRLRLGRIAARHASRPAPKPTAPEPPPEEEDERAAVFLAAFARVRDGVLRPTMAEVGLQLKAAGYPFRIDPGGDERSPSIDFHVILADRRDSKDTIRFLARKDAAQGWQVIGELELKGSPVELTRFETTDEITHDVVQQLVVDAVEQMFASTGEAPRTKSPPLAPAPAPAPAPPAPGMASTAAEPRQPAVAPPAPRVEPVPAPSAPAPGADRLPDATPAPAVATPSYLAASAPATFEGPPAAALRVKRAPAALSGTSMGFVAPKGPALPFTQGAGAASTAPAATTPAPGLATPPSVKRAPAALSGTSMGFVAPKGPALPFEPQASASPPSPPGTPQVLLPPPGTAPAPKPAARHHLNETRALPALSPELIAQFAKGALPFQQGASPIVARHEAEAASSLSEEPAEGRETVPTPPLRPQGPESSVPGSEPWGARAARPRREDDHGLSRGAGG